MKWSIDFKAESGRNKAKAKVKGISTIHLILIALIMGLLIKFIAKGGDLDIVKALLGI